MITQEPLVSNEADDRINFNTNHETKLQKSNIQLQINYKLRR